MGCQVSFSRVPQLANNLLKDHSLTGVGGCVISLALSYQVYIVSEWSQENIVKATSMQEKNSW